MFALPEAESPRARRPRVVGLAVVLVAAAVLLSWDAAHSATLAAFAAVERTIDTRPLLGMLGFVVLAALSAMLAFLSSAVLVPVAVYAWGPWACMALLWLGWFVGGLLAYAVGRTLGRSAVVAVVGAAAVGRLERYASRPSTLIPMVLLQLAVPSDLGGYLFGLARTPLRIFVVALAVAEIPYAVGAVLLGQSFLRRDVLPLALVGVAGLLVAAWAWRHVERARGEPDRSPAAPVPTTGSEP